MKKNMVKIVLVGFLPQDNRHSCKVHPYGCGKVLLKKQGNGVDRLVWLQLVERTNLTGCEDGEDGSNVWQVCFAVQEYTSDENGRQLDDSLVRITDVFLPNSEIWSIRVLFHHNYSYMYVEIVETN